MAKKKVSAKSGPSRSAKKSSSKTSKSTKTNSSKPKSTASKTDPHRKLFLELVHEEEKNSGELYQRRLHAEAVLDRHRERLMAMPMVNGVHVGYRRRDDKIVFPLEICIRVHLSVCKYPEGDPRIAHRVPSNIEDVPVDVLTRRYSIVGNPTSGNLPSANTRASDGGNSQAFDPLIGGVSIARVGASQFGTLGVPAFLGRQQVFVTNEHVVGSSPASVVQPGQSGADVIGDVSTSRPPIRNSRLDSAIVESNFSRAAKVALRKIGGGTLSETLVSGNGLASIAAFKIGATSEEDVQGRIQSLNASVFVEGFGDMHGQIIVAPIDPQQEMIRHGDSGSVLVQRIDSNTLQVIGLCHSAGSDGTLIACHWSDVERQFGIRLFRT